MMSKPKKTFVLLCHLKENPYTPYLEMKNLIVFDHPSKGTIEDYKDLYQRQLITHVKKFAEQRGYPKLAIELSVRSRETKELVKTFLEEDFVIAGRQLNRYGNADEIYFLTTDINEVYSYDPYDNLTASKWILSKYLKSGRLEAAPDTVEIDTNIETRKKSSYVFFSGKRYSSSPQNKFNSKNAVVIVEEYYSSPLGINKINNIKPLETDLSNLYVFDFSIPSLLSKKVCGSNIKLFDREELDSLMFGSKSEEVNENSNKLYRFPHKEIGGLLLISNPERCNLRKIKKIIEKQESAMYVKLGALGKYILDDMPLILAYYPKNSNRAKLEIWGICSLSADASEVELENLRDLESYTDIPKNDGDLLYENTDGDLLFKHLETIEDSHPQINNSQNIKSENIIWKKEDFDKHNSYNATKRVVIFQIKDFIDLFETNSQIDVKDILDTPRYLDDIENIFDFYLSKTEIAKLKSKMYGGQLMPENTKLKIPLKILFVAASPIDEVRLQTDKEYREITDEMKRGTHRDNFTFLNPQLAVTITNLITAMNENPNVIHFSGHGNIDGISITTNDNKSQFLSMKTMERIFKNKESIPRLILLNSCYSSEQAKHLSQFGYVIGNKCGVGDNAAISFAKGLYNGLGAGKKFTDAINDGLIVLEAECPDSQNIIEVWNKGEKIEI